MSFPIGATSQSVDILIVDDNGQPVTGLVAATFPSLIFSLAGSNADVAFPILVDLALITTAWTNGGVKERGEGRYRLDVFNAAFAAEGHGTIRGEASNKRVICPTLEIGNYARSAGQIGPVVTITVTDSVTSDPVQGALVALLINQSRYEELTNASGVAVLRPNEGDATYLVHINQADYEPMDEVELEVEGNTAEEYELDPQVITPSAAGFVTGYVVCYDDDGDVVPDILVSIQQTAMTGTGIAFDATIRTSTSNGSGIAEFDGMFKGGTYRIFSGISPQTGVDVTIPTGATSPYKLPNIPVF